MSRREREGGMEGMKAGEKERERGGNEWKKRGSGSTIPLSPLLSKGS